MRKKIVLLLLAIGLSAGCSLPGDPNAPARTSESAQPLKSLHAVEDPRTITGPSTAHVADADIAAVNSNPAPRLPVTVTDAQDTKVTVERTDRILALDTYGTLAATVFGLGLGSHVVGRDTSTGFPAAAKLPLVTPSAHQLSAEAILKLHPSVIITDTTIGPWDVVLQMRDAGIPVVITDSRRSIDNISIIVDQVATALGVPAAGHALNTRIQADIATTKTSIDRLAPRQKSKRLRMVFLYMRGQAGVYYMFGKGTGADALINGVDGIDVASQVGFTGMKPIDTEALAKAKPDVILMMSKGLESVGGVDGALKVPGVAQTPAGQNRRFVDMSDYQILSFGPQTPRVLDALARALYTTSTP